MKVTVYSDVACPWCYIGKRRFETALAGFEHAEQVEVEWRSYQLDPTLPERSDLTEVEYLTRMKGLAEPQVRRMLDHVVMQAAGEGLTYDMDAIVVANSFPAHRVIQRARAVSAEAASALEEALFAAHFERGQDIGDAAVLAELGAAAGLSAEQVEEALTDERWAEAVRADLAEARAVGVTGVPFFVLDGKYAVSGAQPPELFAQALAQTWAERAPLRAFTPAAAADDDDAPLTGQACGPDGCA